MTFDLDAYLRHIGLVSVQPDISGLFAMQQAQLHAVPFENLDPITGIVPALDIESIFEKTVRQRRGGYCFELNTLFGSALRSVGFDVERRMARVRMRMGPEGPRSHLMLLVRAEGNLFLADAGFGGPGSLVPLRLDEEEAQISANGTYRIQKDAERAETVLQRKNADDWTDIYAFDQARVSDGDITTANYVCATWNGAPFAKHAMLGCYRGDTRYGLFDRQLTIETSDSISRETIADFSEFADLLIEQMGIGLHREALKTIWDKIAINS